MKYTSRVSIGQFSDDIEPKAHDLMAIMLWESSVLVDGTSQ